uniref:Putative secreted protein n=1 Tax=Anopheles darlingi TaxID=43151 RepID=A0A2M4DK17_ANODA
MAGDAVPVAVAAAVPVAVAVAVVLPRPAGRRCEPALDFLSLMLFRYSDGLIRWFEPSPVPLGKLGGTNGRTSCLLTRFGPGRWCWCWCWLSPVAAASRCCCCCCCCCG